MCGKGERSTTQQQVSRTGVQRRAGETTVGKYSRNHAEIQEKIEQEASSASSRCLLSKLRAMVEGQTEEEQDESPYAVSGS